MTKVKDRLKKATAYALLVHVKLCTSLQPVELLVQEVKLSTHKFCRISLHSIFNHLLLISIVSRECLYEKIFKENVWQVEIQAVKVGTLCISLS